jgi:hypothetical protein
MAKNKAITNKKATKAEVNAILADFFKKSGDIVDNAIKRTHKKYPLLFK